MSQGLAGGFKVGDRVSCLGRLGTVVGGPARVACIRLSVAVRYDDGRIVDERIANIELLVEELPDEEPEEMGQASAPPAAWEEQQMASQNMWGDAQGQAPEMNGGTMRPEAFQEGPQDEAPPPADFDQGAAGYGPDEAEAALRDKIYSNYPDLRDAFKALDQSGDGYVERGAFFQAMGNILLNNGYSEDDIYEVADRFDLNKDGYMSFEEFVGVIQDSAPPPAAPQDDGPGDEQAPEPEGQGEEEQEQEEEPSYLDDPELILSVEKGIAKFKIVIDQKYSSVRQAFLSMDRERRGSVAPQKFAQGLLAHGVSMTNPELELAYSAFDREGKGFITYTDFCAVMTQRFSFGLLA